MKKKKGKKKKFKNFEFIDSYNNNQNIKNQNDDTFYKDDKYESNYTKKNNDFKLKTALDKLIFLFPNFSSDVIKDFYEENDNNFSRTKDILKQLSEIDNPIEENKIYKNNENNDNNMIIEENEIKEGNNNNKNNNEKNKNRMDITHLAQFEIAGNDENLEDIGHKEDNNNIYKVNNQEEKENNNNKDHNYLLDLKDKNKNAYISIFNEETNNNNINNYNCSKNYSTNDEVIIDDYLFDQNIEFLCDCFPDYKREEIIVKICDSNFDIDTVVLDLLNETNINFQQNEDELANMEITDREQILSNFLSFENGKQNDFDIELFQDNLVQKEIEEMIKKENANKQNNNIFEEDDYIDDNNQNKINGNDNEEYFLNKKIDDIKTPKIKEDLKKLIKHFPLEEEFKIKLVYYQYMNYQMTYKYFSKKDDTKNVGLKSLLNSSNDKYNFSYNRNAQVKRYNNKKPVNKYQNLEEKRQFEIFKKIIDKKPINWKLEEDKNYNLNDYMAVRKRLIIEAKNAYGNKQYKNGQILMAKAKRYKQEIDKIYKNNKIQQFAQNNENRNSNEIDLHGLNVQESKYIIDRKIKSLKEKKIENNLKSLSLTIITGTGSHSVGHRPVLYPSLLDWLRNRDKLSVKGEISKGMIFVTIY